MKSMVQFDCSITRLVAITKKAMNTHLICCRGGWKALITQDYDGRGKGNRYISLLVRGLQNVLSSPNVMVIMSLKDSAANKWGM